VWLTIIQHANFVSDWRTMRLDDNDLRNLEAIFLKDPRAGPVMAGTGGLRKLRFAPASRHSGKSGATRVGYAYFPEVAWIFLILIFSKNTKANVTPAERVQIKTLLERIKRSLPKGPP
jgi:hypothetical protein